MRITFANDPAYFLSDLSGWTVDLTYVFGQAPYCANPVVVSHVDADGDLVVWEADANGAPLRNSTFAIPLEAIEEVQVV